MLSSFGVSGRLDVLLKEAHKCRHSPWQPMRTKILQMLGAAPRKAGGLITQVYVTRE
jgi:hypothetical protein